MVYPTKPDGFAGAPGNHPTELCSAGAPSMYPVEPAVRRGPRIVHPTKAALSRGPRMTIPRSLPPSRGPRIWTPQNPAVLRGSLMCRPRAFVSWFSRLRANPGVRRGSGFFVFVCACSPVRECRRAGFRHGEEDGERWEDPATAYSPTCGHAVPSALRGFTAEFGMGSGGAPSLRSPGRRNAPGFFSGGFGIVRSRGAGRVRSSD